MVKPHVSTPYPHVTTRAGIPFTSFHLSPISSFPSSGSYGSNCGGGDGADWGGPGPVSGAGAVWDLAVVVAVVVAVFVAVFVAVVVAVFVAVVVAVAAGTAAKARDAYAAQHATLNTTLPTPSSLPVPSHPCRPPLHLPTHTASGLLLVPLASTPATCKLPPLSTLPRPPRPPAVCKYP